MVRVRFRFKILGKWVRDKGLNAIFVLLPKLIDTICIMNEKKFNSYYGRQPVLYMYKTKLIKIPLFDTIKVK